MRAFFDSKGDVQMTKKPVKTKAKPPAAKTIIMFGLDKDRKPHAARFNGENEALLAKAAAAMGMRLAVPITKKHFEIVSKLPVGKIHATGSGLVPNVDQQLYDQIGSLFGGELSPISTILPKSSAQLAPGHLVIAQANVEDGWWPAVIVNRRPRPGGRRCRPGRILSR
jgi:hypothetical protein